MASRTPTRRPWVAGNWKMNLDHVEAIHLVQELALRLRTLDVKDVDISVHPPFTDLRSVEGLIGAESLPISLGAQHCSEHIAGAFTGEISPAMLARLSVSSVIVGHSERRTLYGMDDALVASTTAAVLRSEMRALICVGESAQDREAGEAIEVLTRQVTAALEGVPPGAEASIAFAYEPIWAIGTGVAATPEDAQEACALIRTLVASQRDAGAAAGIQILYGGSATADNASELVGSDDVDGLLVGGASLNAESFAAIVGEVLTCYGLSAG